ncbi:hypothetical protein [Xanthomonas sacchari]|uniref:hypothetical protein n=1 Tax=Xanthomonas sacchari TaxID=56458 RepID=UPI00058239C4|nr:hypothetical protein [Xanthomonas sacchari]AJC45626.1 hypothetical protein SB85_07395 [Xanthomonas sacchari]
MFTPRSLSLVAAFCATLLTCSAQAKTCTAVDNIVASTASDTANRDAGGTGGHFGLHMQNATTPLPPSGAQSQLGKSAFANWATFQGAFNNWAAAKTGKHAECGTSGGKRDIADAATVGVTSGWKCTAVGKNNICTEWTEFTPVKVCFWYANTRTTNGKWLLNTAYPSLNADCS